MREGGLPCKKGRRKKQRTRKRVGKNRAAKDTKLAILLKLETILEPRLTIALIPKKNKKIN